ncbi:hypothetical protein M3Y99_00359400 [Aphelenchoides fujianensis]|nr:hypothetical protein M3Y99_00359400 [Aphelenchoides fujianensis]
MARVNAEVFTAGLPVRNPRAFTAVDRERAAQMSSFRSERAVRVRDVDVESEERRITNDRTSLLLRTLKQNWKNMANGAPSTAFGTSKSTAKTTTAEPPSSSDRAGRRAHESADNSGPASKHRRAS